jgi:hypothetical protein
MRRRTNSAIAAATRSSKRKVEMRNTLQYQASERKRNHPFMQIRNRGQCSATTERTLVVGELAALKADAHHWLTDSEYAALRHRLEAAHAAAEAALVEARRRRVRLNERQGE